MSDRRALQYYCQWLRLTFDPANKAFKSARNFFAFFAPLALIVLTPFLNKHYPFLGPRMSEFISYIPIFIVFVILPALFFSAPYRIHKEQEQKTNTLQARLDAIEQSRSQIKYYGWETFRRRIPTERAKDSYEDAFFACLKFRNKTSRSDDLGIAKKVVALISYHDSKGGVIGTYDVGEWWNGLTVPLPTDRPLEEVEFGIGVPRILSIAFKARDEGCYGFSCHSHSRPGWRFKKLRLSEKEYTVRVTLQGVNLPEITYTFLLKNPGSGHPLTLDYLVPDTGELATGVTNA